MASLSIFPVEVLEWITSVVFACDQVRLWLCGDRILNIKLKKGGLKRTSFWDSGSSWIPFPRSYFTIYGSLEEVECSSSLSTSLCPTLEFHLLPKTLKRLSLACDDVFVLMAKQNVRMDELLPLLHSLHLSGCRLREENLKHLPSNLIDLHVTSSNEEIKSSNIFQDLPRSIQRLTLLFEIVDQSEHENDLPSELVSLHVYSLTSSFNWISKLPKSLKMLRISDTDLDPEWLIHLPPLEALSLMVSLPKSTLTQLPQSLKELELCNIQGICTGEGLIPFLPKNLTKLRLESERYLILQPLPVSLTDFEVYVSPTHPDMMSFFHSETIRILIGSDPFSEQLNISSFPNKLQYLTINYIDDGICAMLPAGLRTIEMKNGHITNIGASKFPKSLTSLRTYFEVFDNHQTLTYCGHISNLDLQVKRLNTEVNGNWLASLLPSSYPTGSNKDSLDDCNNHLTSLSVRGVGTRGKACPLVSFPTSLPKFPNLKSLQIVGWIGISSDWLCSIPQKVTNLKIQWLDGFPTAAQFSKLPQCLRYLDIEVMDRQGNLECDWSDEVFQVLPRSLQTFWMNGSLPKVTQRAHQYLPPNLREASLDSDVFGENFLTPLDRMYGKLDDC